MPAFPVDMPTTTPVDHAEVAADVVGLAQASASVISTKTAAYTAVPGDFIKADATTAAFTITLPTTPPSGSAVTVIKIDATANAVTVDPPGAVTVNGEATATITEQYAGAIFVYDGSNWLIRSVM